MKKPKQRKGWGNAFRGKLSIKKAHRLGYHVKNVKYGNKWYHFIKEK